jgi:hypothetical protein
MKISGLKYNFFNLGPKLIDIYIEKNKLAKEKMLWKLL